jgi:hypothetical protein
LYVFVQPCADCEPELRATRDGGRSWITRGTLADLNLARPPHAIQVSRAGSVGVSGPRTIGGDPGQGMSVSVDRGRTFAGVTPTDTPVEVAPPDALVSCGWQPPANRCVVQVVDLDAGTVAQLANQPDLVAESATRAPDGTLRAVGVDGATNRPAVASSTDGGQTWLTHAFTGAPELSSGYRPLAASVYAIDGTVVVSLAYAPSNNLARISSVAFRLGDGGWQALDLDGLSLTAMATSAAYLAADGTHVVQKVVPPAGSTTGSGGALVQFWTCAPGETTYHRVDPPAGLNGDVLTDVVRLPGGGYLARSVHNAWVSGDGRSWQQVAIR